MKQTTAAWPAGVRRTKQREAIWDVLQQASSPLSARDIAARLGAEGAEAWLSTVYRTLDLLVSRGSVTRITRLDSDMAVYSLQDAGHRHYAVCLKCHKIIPMTNCPMDEFIPRLEDRNFLVLGHQLELYGYCSSCKAAAVASPSGKTVADPGNPLG
ncbi:MAG: Fur family transcriptional regulator [Oscillospiraceae bacterium]|nr:Fur family transcriptional regulator [Oscillospiraceae bacterium]MDD4367321.1 Fur family transcriptional regulator [Oscillospiraceae bacterium]